MVVTAVIGGLLLIGVYGFALLSGVRAYVEGEGLWAKGQKDSTYHLIQYAYSKDPARYQAFLDSLEIPLGDYKARKELEKADPDMAVVVQGFRKGGNHPDDIPSMIRIFKRFRHIQEIDQAIAQWETGDQLIQKLLQTGERLELLIERGETDPAERNRIVTTINSLQQKLHQVEIEFSAQMSSAARQTATFLHRAMLTFSLIGGVICILIFVYVGQLILRLKDYNEKLAAQAESERSIKNALMESEERYRSLFNNNHAAMLLIDPDSAAIVDANPAAIAYYGWSLTEITAKKISDINTLTREQLFAEMERAKTERRRNFFFRHRLANGEIREVEVYSGPIILKGRQYLYSIVHDITDRIEAEQQREKLIKELQEASREIKQLRGFLPLCSYCKKVRNDQGYWEQVDVYIRKHSRADISHGICPECAKEHFPDLDIFEDEN